MPPFSKETLPLKSPLTLTTWPSAVVFVKGPSHKTSFYLSLVTSTYDPCDATLLGCTLKSPKVFVEVVTPKPQPPDFHLIGLGCGLAIEIF